MTEGAVEMDLLDPITMDADLAGIFARMESRIPAAGGLP